MKKGLKNIGIIVAIVACLIIICVILFLEGDLTKIFPKDEPSTTKEYIEETYKYTPYQVIADELAGYCAVEGCVETNYDGELATYYNEFKIGTKKEVKVENGSEVQVGTVLYTIEDVAILSEIEGRVLYIDETETTIKVECLDYNQLFISIQVPMHYYKLLQYDANIIVNSQYGETNARIRKMGHKVENEKMEVIIGGIDSFMMPGSIVEVLVGLTKTENKLFLNKDAIITVSGAFYIDTCEADANGPNYDLIRRDSIMVGESYIVIENGQRIEYMVIENGAYQSQYAIIKELLPKQSGEDNE